MVQNSLSRNILSVSGSTTLAIDAKAKELKKAGYPIISYAAGEPDFPTPANIVEGAKKACLDPVNYKYTPAAGLPDFREAIAAKTLKDSKLSVSPSQVLVTNGGKQAVYTACQTLLNPEDEVLLPAPYWTSYPEIVRLTGALATPVMAGIQEGYKLSVSRLEAARTPKTKVLIFVSPSNPTGAVYSEAETAEIGQWCLEKGIWVITDEIYQNIYYLGQTAPSIVGTVPELAEQTILVNGLAKSYAMTGWRLGWMIGPKKVVKAAINLQSHLCSNVSDIMQRAGIEALTGDQESVSKMREAFLRRRDLILEELGRIPGLSVSRPDGAFYAYPEVTKLLGRRLDGKTVKTSSELAEAILNERYVACVPGEAFGTPGYLRFSYALDDESLVEGIRRLQDLLA